MKAILRIFGDNIKKTDIDLANLTGFRAGSMGFSVDNNQFTDEGNAARDAIINAAEEAHLKIRLDMGCGIVHRIEWRNAEFETAALVTMVDDNAVCDA